MHSVKLYTAPVEGDLISL